METTFFTPFFCEDDKADLNNHSNQLNDNNDAYWSSRGYDSRPDDWQDRK